MVRSLSASTTWRYLERGSHAVPGRKSLTTLTWPLQERIIKQSDLNSNGGNPKGCRTLSGHHLPSSKASKNAVTWLGPNGRRIPQCLVPSERIVSFSTCLRAAAEEEMCNFSWAISPAPQLCLACGELEICHLSYLGRCD